MLENKTAPSEASVERYLAEIASPSRRQDCEALAKLMGRASGDGPRMWGNAIVGFGVRSYHYDSGRKGETCRVGFSSRKGDISIYGVSTTPGAEALLAKLGKHKLGKGCLYISTLGDIEPKVLEQLIANAVQVGET